MKNLLLCDDLSVVDNLICPPPTTEPPDLGDLLSVVAERLEPNGVLMLSGRWSRYVTEYQERGGAEHPQPAHAGDWTAKILQGDTWIRWTHPADRHALWTCEVDSIEPGGRDAPLISDNAVVTAANFQTWYETTGVPWVGTPGMAGNALLIDGWQDMNPRSPEPRWHTTGVWLPGAKGGDGWTFGVIEQPYTPAKWERSHDGPLHGYDQNKAYLSAYQVVELPADALKRNPYAANGHQVPFDPREGGIWRVQLSPWSYGDFLPDPAGYGPALEDGSRWLTTPTLTLLQQLTDRGDYAGFSIMDAWTAPTRRITRKWAELINDTATAAREPIATAARRVYKATYGMWARGGRVSRPDWHYTLIAQARTNLWRKMDQAYRIGSGTIAGGFTEGPGAGHMPVRVETDCVFYGGISDWERDAPYGFKLDPTGRKVGHFKPYEPKGDK